jgi:hypothetical protein
MSDEDSSKKEKVEESKLNSEPSLAMKAFEALLDTMEAEEREHSLSVGPAPAELLQEAIEKFQFLIRMPCDFCGKQDSSLVCSGCENGQYCSQKCQKWALKDEHKRECSKIKHRYDQIAEQFMKLGVFTRTYEEKRNEPCSICLETVPFKDLLQLPCHHVYCISCITKAETAASQFRFKCPHCRDPLQTTLLTHTCWAIDHLILQADYYSTYDSAKSDSYVQLAAMEWNRLQKLTDQVKFLDKKLAFKKNFYQLRLLLLEKEYLFAIYLADKLFKDHEKELNQNHLYKFEILYCDGMARAGLGKYHLAIQTLISAYRLLTYEDKEKNCPAIYRKCVDQICLLSLKLKDEFMLFSFAEAAFEVDEVFDGLLGKIMFDYYKNEKHDSELAIQCLKAAIRYECPWSHEHKEMLKQKLQLEEETKEKMLQKRKREVDTR